MTISIFTLGCKTNSYESLHIANELRSRGHTVYTKLCYSDVYIINTCAITAQAEHKSRQAVSRARRYNAKAHIIVVGCASEHHKEQFESLDNVVLVKGTGDKYDILQHIETISAVGNSVLDKTRAFVKIQDGCNNYCSYCIVPYLRGSSTSRNIDDIVQEVERANAVETVLIGIDISQYGLDNGSSLSMLIDALAGTHTRIRLGSIEPRAITPQLLDSLSRVEFCPHFHLSLQSGSDSVLQRMNRHYTTDQYALAVDSIRKVWANASITCDIIVGFCGESEQEFAQTMQYVQDIGFADIHIFPYSPREGTVAYSMEQVDNAIKTHRVAMLSEVRDRLVHLHLQQYIGREVTVLAERAKAGHEQGYTDNYIHVVWHSDVSMRGQLVKVVLKSIQSESMYGEVVYE